MGDRLGPLQRQRNALTHTNAHGSQRMTLAAALKIPGGAARYTCARHAKRMAERDCTAAPVKPRIVLGEAKRAGASDHLHRKGFVEFEHGEIAHTKCKASE